MPHTSQPRARILSSEPVTLSNNSPRLSLGLRVPASGALFPRSRLMPRSRSLTQSSRLIQPVWQRAIFNGNWVVELGALKSSKAVERKVMVLMVICVCDNSVVQSSGAWDTGEAGWLRLGFGDMCCEN